MKRTPPTTQYFVLSLLSHREGKVCNVAKKKFSFKKKGFTREATWKSIEFWILLLLSYFVILISIAFEKLRHKIKIQKAIAMNVKKILKMIIYIK